ncbi:hypothetical protein [Streptomyces sp. BPTC-684]|uniref:hypothetical protein n=1 Tax=Streptomyces sp. BPTC-684 TaxID=3043734 RepID=UPI0024B22C38|nr:hypothetical protein [Streptomyces sp. BPTC-684]WHM40472.1 hypothetical protein QIY60_28820 [Streptomyces sp. BPTC-684]
MTDPVTVGAVTAILVRWAQHAAGVAVDGLVTDRARSVWDAVANRFRRDPQADGALRRLGDQPGNANRRAAVADHLEELLAGDPEFARTLAALVAAEGDGRARGTRVENAGAAVIGGGSVDIRGGGIAAGRDVTVSGFFQQRTTAAEESTEADSGPTAG